MTSPPPGSSDPRRSRTRRLLATLASVALSVGLAVPAAAATSTPAPTPTAAPADPSLALSPVSNGILRPGESLGATATLQNPGSFATDPVPVAFRLGTAPLRDRSALDRWLDGDTAGVAVAEVGATTLGAVSSEDQGSVSLNVPATDPVIAGRAPGVYPLSVQAGDLVATSVVVVPDTAAATSGLAVVFPITVGVRRDGLLTASELADLTAVDGPLTAQLDAVDGTAATLAVDPAIPAAIRVLGTSAPPTAISWLQRLLALPNARFALQFGDADLSAQINAGLAAPLEPISLSTYMSAADFATPVTTSTSSPTPTPSPSSGAPSLPDLATLLDVGPATASVYWPATGSAGPGVVGALAASGDADQPARILLPSSSVSDGTVPVDASVGGVSTPVYDADITAALTRAAGENDVTRRGSDLAAAVSMLALARADAGGRPLLVAVDRGTDRARASLRATLAAATTAPGFAAVPLGEVVGGAASAISPAEPEADAARVAEVTQLVSDEAVIDRFATVLEQPELLTGRERAEMLQLLGTSWSGDAAREAVAAHRSETQETLQSVGILSSDFRLVSSSAPLRPWIRNDLPWPVSVVLVARPDDVRLRVQEQTPIEAQADANTRVEVPVEARVANGEVSVALQLYSPTGEPIGDPQGVDVEVRAEWENIGLIVIILLVIGFIGMGVARTVGRRRALRREVASTLETPLTEPEVRDAAGAPAEPEVRDAAGAPADAPIDGPRADADRGAEPRQEERP
ncbi:DUF6049 family protein [Microbacterium enclense]|uniref:DUF6049 family protein n=1 Tax=Microbacterium enclense TaxID=993073 RepID=UPI0036DA9587